MRASIVVASHNEGVLLDNTIKSCLETTSGLDCEIIVTDDASNDGSIERIRKQFDPVRIIASTTRQGVSPTKDRGARHAQGNVIVFLDGHCKPEPGAIARLVEAVEEWNGKAIVTPRVATLNPQTWQNRLDSFGHGYTINLATFETGWIGLDQMKLLVGPGGGTYYKQPTMIGCCAAVGRDVYEKLWGFDVGMKYYGSEDVDFGIKSWLMGYPVLHDPIPIIGHRFRERFDSYTAPSEHVFANQLRMARKNFGEDAWKVWVGRYQKQPDSPFWQSAWKVYTEESASVELEHEYLMAHRTHDEFWHANEFNLAWPRVENLAAVGPTPLNEGTPSPIVSPTIPIHSNPNPTSTPTPMPQH